MFKSQFRLTLAAALLFAGANLALAQKETPLVTKTEDQWIAVLTSDAPQKEKADACRELAVIGSRKAVAALAALLPDEKFNHMARYGLETIPDPAVDEALRNALGKLKGRPLVGVIGSIGVRRDAQATDALARLLADGDADTAQAAARALGKIGTTAAAKAIEAALDSAPAGNQVAFCEGLLRCAEALTANGDREAALKVYQGLMSRSALPHQVRAGALRGSILSDPKNGLALLRRSLGSDDWILVAAAARTAMELRTAEVARALAAELPKLPEANQILVIQTLGRLGNPAGLPPLSTAAKAGPKNVRLAAIKALPELSLPAAAPVLIGLLGDPERDLAQTAQEGLAALPGTRTDAAIMAMLKGNDTAKRIVAMDLMARRRMTSAVPALLKAAADPEPAVRAAALRRAGELASVNELPALLDCLMQAKGDKDIEAAEQAISAVSAKSGDTEGCVTKLSGLFAQAPAPQKCALVRIVGALGGANALKAVRAAVDDPNAEVHATAIRTLGDWKTADAAPDLLALAKAAGDPKDKLLCLRSCLGLARNTEFAEAQRLSICREAAALVQKSDEKRLLLGALGSIASTDSLALVTPYLSDAETKEEASAATVSIAEQMLKGKDSAKVAPKLIEPLQKAAQATGNADLAKRAQTLLDSAQKKAGSK